MTARLVPALAAAALVLLPATAFAYVGPGAGFALIGSFFGLLLALVAGAVSLLLWPARYLVRSARRRKALGARPERFCGALGAGHGAGSKFSTALLGPGGACWSLVVNDSER